MPEIVPKTVEALSVTFSLTPELCQSLWLDGVMMPGENVSLEELVGADWVTVLPFLDSITSMRRMSLDGTYRFVKTATQFPVGLGITFWDNSVCPGTAHWHRTGLSVSPGEVC